MSNLVWRHGGGSRLSFQVHTYILLCVIRIVDFGFNCVAPCRYAARRVDDCERIPHTNEFVVPTRLRALYAFFLCYFILRGRLARTYDDLCKLISLRHATDFLRFWKRISRSPMVTMTLGGRLRQSHVMVLREAATLEVWCGASVSMRKLKSLKVGRSAAPVYGP